MRTEIARIVIEKGAAMLGWNLDELMDKTLRAMRACESEPGQFQNLVNAGS